MTQHPNDEFGDLLRAAARDYNRPGETPRERMWEQIRAQRARTTTVVRPAAWHRIVLPAVAAALLVIGVAIGRFYERSTGARVASKLAVKTPPAPISSPTPAPNIIPESAQVVAAAPDSNMDRTRRAGSPLAHPAPAPFEAPSRTDNSDVAFRLAVLEHLAGTEAMLTSFRNEAAHGDVDAQITSWARKLLTTTRLLEAAAPQEDPTMKRLLDDLELVLVQIAQYSPTNPHRAEELELIEHSIQRRGVIGNLHTTLPARFVPSGT
jgi:hypothetical protein